MNMINEIGRLFSSSVPVPDTSQVPDTSTMSAIGPTSCALGPNKVKTVKTERLVG